MMMMINNVDKRAKKQNEKILKIPRKNTQIYLMINSRGEARMTQFLPSRWTAVVWRSFKTVRRFTESTWSPLSGVC